MKRLVIVAIMAAFLLGTVGAAQAIELKAKGDWQMSANYVKNPEFNKDDKDDPFQAVQRVRTTFEFIANENLKGVVRFHTGDVRWGGNEDRGGLDIGNRLDWNYDMAYLDFLIPNTQVNIKAGLQPVTLPGSLGSHILADNVWGVVGSTQFNDMVGLTFGWARLADFEDGGVDTTTAGGGATDSKNKDEVDMFMAIVPVTMDGMQFNPFLAYARAGKNAFNDDGAADYTDTNYTSSNLFWAGLNFTVDMFDPITVMGDFNYGTQGKFYDDGGANSKSGQTAGWIAALAVQYQMDMFTPMIYGLYESGESRSSAGNDSKGKVMPTLSGDLWGVSSFGFSGSQLRGNVKDRIGALDNNEPFGPSGKMALGLKLKDISFMDKLTHTFNVAYYRGTNHKDNIGSLTKKDYAWELNFDTQYQVYESLAAIVELGYMNVNLDDNASAGAPNRSDLADDAAWKAAAGVRYRF